MERLYFTGDSNNKMDLRKLTKARLEVPDKVVFTKDGLLINSTEIKVVGSPKKQNVKAGDIISILGETVSVGRHSTNKNCLVTITPMVNTDLVTVLGFQQDHVLTPGMESDLEVRVLANKDFKIDELGDSYFELKVFS